MAILKYLTKGARRVVETVRQDGIAASLGTLRLYSQALRKQPGGVALPREIQFEVSNVCNLHCPMCSYASNVTGAKRPLLDKETFHAVVDGMPDLKVINFTGLGESLVNPHLAYFIEHSVRRGIRTCMISNGLLFSEKKTRAMADAGLNKLSLSIESGLPDVYAAKRLGGTLDEFKTALGVIQKERASRQACFTLSFNVLFTPENTTDDRHLMSIVDLAAEQGVPEITFQNAHDIEQLFGHPYNAELEERLRRIFAAVSARATPHGIACRFPSLNKAAGCCYYPWIYPYVTALGEVLPCCIVPQFGDYNAIIEEMTLGNAAKTSMAEVWNGPRAVAFRRSLASDTPHPYCARCSKYWNVL